MIPEAEWQQATAQQDVRTRGHLDRIRQDPMPALDAFIRNGLEYEADGSVQRQSELEYLALRKVVDLDADVRRRAFTLSSGYLARVVRSIVEAPPQLVHADTDLPGHDIGCECRIKRPAWLMPLQSLLDANWRITNDPPRTYTRSERDRTQRYLVQQCPRIVKRLYDDRLLVRGCVRAGTAGPVRRCQTAADLDSIGHRPSQCGSRNL